MSLAKKSLGQLLCDTFLLLKRNLFSLSGVVFATYFPLGFLSFLFFWVTFVFKDKIDIFFAQKSILAVIVFIVFFSALIAVVFLTMMLFSIAIIKKIKACDEKKGLSVQEAYRCSVAALGPFCIVSLWVLLKVSLWSLLLIIPGIVFALFYSFAQIVFVLEDKRGLAALVRSRNIIQPYFWEFIGKSLVAGLIFFVISGPCQLIVYLAFPSKVGWDPIMAAVLVNFINGFLGVFPVVFGYFLYKDLKERGI